jgi:branched-chain amino acid transport system permease protein
MQVFLQQLINGLSLGLIYALIALGYTMVYGVLRLINFAHGDVYMVGAMVGWYTAARWYRVTEPTWYGLPLVMLTAMAACAVLGFLIERLAYRPLRDQPRIASLITAIGVSMLLEFGGQYVFGPDPRAFPPLLPDRTFDVGGVTFGLPDVVIFAVTIALMLGLRYVVLHTRTGLALRAVSFRFDAAALMGVNVDRIISLTFVFGSVLAAAAGVLVAVRAPTVDPLMGLLPGLKAFVAAVLGGIGNIGGAVAGGVLLGLVETMIAGYFPRGSQYKDGVAFVILILVLLVKPSGLMGKETIEKV